MPSSSAGLVEMLTGSSPPSGRIFSAPSPPVLSIFHRSADPEPRPGRSCLPLNYFTRSIYLQALCQGPFKP